MKWTAAAALGAALLSVASANVAAAALNRAQALERLAGFDDYMQSLLREWNGVGFAVGIVVGEELVLARGYGYRDYGQRLPLTRETLFPIASNTKLFAAVSAGLLVEEGKLTWDAPIRESVPSIHFYDDALNSSVTLRDMLAHRTGLARSDAIWFYAGLDSGELFERLRYLEPRARLRYGYLYNNVIYASVGHIVAMKSGQRWPDFVRQRIFEPLEMRSSGLSVAEMAQSPNHAVPYTEHRDSRQLYRLPFYTDTAGIAAAGGIVSNLVDMSHWLSALMNEGRFQGRQALSPGVLKATLEPAMSLPNTDGEQHGWWELLNRAQGLGRRTASYRGHLIAFHGGDLGGFHSQVSYMPNDGIGVIVLVIGDHAASLRDPIGYHVYERLLGISLTPWSGRMLQARAKKSQSEREARAKSGAEKVPQTRPSHPARDYVGDYEQPAFGVLKITQRNGVMRLDYHQIHSTLSHFHYDRFETEDDELDGQRSLSFVTNLRGEVEQAVLSLDDGPVSFVRGPKPPATQ